MDDMFNPNEPLIQKLRVMIRFSVRCLAVLMTLVILWGVVTWPGRFMENCEPRRSCS